MGKYLPILTIARCGSLNKAAGELGYSQPNLWHIVNNLEAELGAKIFHRSRQGVTLTEAGEALLERMARIEAQESSLHQYARTYHKSLVRLGLFPGLSGQWTAELLAELKQSRPDLRLRVETTASYHDGLAAVEDRALDCCFSVLSGSRETEALPLWEEPYVLVTGADHPLAQKEQARLEDVLGKVPLIPTGDSFDPDGPLWELYRRTEHVLMADSAPLDPAFALALAEQGMGVALLPATALDRVSARENARCIPLLSGPVRTVTLLCGPKENRSPLAEEVVDSILASARKSFPLDPCASSASA